MSLTAVALLTGVMLSLAGHLIPFFYFPAAAGLGLLSHQKNAKGALICCAGMIPAILINPSEVSVILAVIVICACIISSAYLESSGKYFSIFFAVFFSMMTLCLAAGFASGWDIISILISRLSRVMLYTFAGQHEMTLNEPLGGIIHESFRMLPSFIAALFMVVFILNRRTILLLSKNRKRLLKGNIPLSSAPVFLFSASVAGMIFVKAPYWQFIFRNLLFVTVFIFFLRGMGILYFIASRPGMSFFTKNLILPVLMILFVILHPIPVSIGIMDIWINFRKKFRPDKGLITEGGDNENNLDQK